MITQEQAEAAADYIRDHAGEFAKAKANRIQLEEWRKSQKAILFQQAPDGSIPAKESFAYSHPDYLKVLEGIKESVETEERLRWIMKAAELKIEIWRTQEANSRRG
jgi:hypothetical protein